MRPQLKVNAVFNIVALTMLLSIDKAVATMKICPVENRVSDYILQEIDERILLLNHSDGSTLYLPAKCAGHELTAIDASFYIGNQLVFSTYLEKVLYNYGEAYTVEIDKGHPDLRVEFAVVYLGNEYSCSCIFERGPVPVGNDNIDHTGPFN